LITTCIDVSYLGSPQTDFYIATRTIYNIASDEKAPKFMTRTNDRGVPILAMVLPALFCLLAYMSITSGAKSVFGYLTTMVATFGRSHDMSITSNLQDIRDS
jgi:amino acid transporter